ncbi:MAG: phosphoribosyl-ATP pyrophosphohydrolase [Paenibacillus sp.]|nr:phosphoribosyl-ATP pyrophosphohydrolase [Paenibacillus sp.]
MPTYNKLVRDLIPQIIDKKNKSLTTRILNDSEYILELKNKLGEEVEEYLSASNDQDAIEELADIMELLHALAEVHGASPQDLEKVRAHKAEQRGGFKDRIYLI